MKQEHKELLLKDLCARLPYGVIVEYEGNLSKLDTIFMCDSISISSTSMDKELSYNLDLDEVKPYLFPLSSITIEQEKELSKLGVSYGEYALHDDIRGLGIYVDEAYIFFEFCYKHHIDFLGLIEMGLAKDATELNIY